MRNLHVEEIECKTILNKSNMPWTDYTLNAYGGCPFGCSYCYVPAMRNRFKLEDEHPWGTWVQIKINAADVLRRQMLNVDPAARIAIGTASDSWQPIEKRYRITRAILQELSNYPNHIGIVSRSPLIIRDIDLFQQMEDVGIAISIPTFDEVIRKHFEPDAPAIPGRLEAIRRLVAAGLHVNVNWAPILPGITDNRETAVDYFARISTLGVRRVMCNTLSYTDFLGQAQNKLAEAYYEKTGRPKPRSLPGSELKRIVEVLGRKYGVRVLV